MSSLEDEIFARCQEINDLLLSNKEQEARDGVIKLLDFHQQNEITIYTPLVNHLIREVGLFPYMQPNSSIWEDNLVYESFRVKVGGMDEKVLHLGQSCLLKKLLDGENVAVSAPTSFGKSFIVDVFIELKKPKNVVIIVPTIALMDETRRRIYKKFSSEYNIVTTLDANLEEKNIFIFPQERALFFKSQIKEIDLLIIDEFYKASIENGDERALSLLECILTFSVIAKQRYYLAPNIDVLPDNLFTKGMPFCKLKFQTVFLNIQNLYGEIKKSQQKKDSIFIDILNKNIGKTLVYAGTFVEIKNITSLIVTHISEKKSDILLGFSQWISDNYSSDWSLVNLIKRGVGIHHGRLHRSLSQIEVNVFEQCIDLNVIISTSSIIEGVNTSAKNIVIWSKKSGKGRSAISNFTYKNIIGRGGRMFRHFVGNVFVLDEMKPEQSQQLNLPIPNEILVSDCIIEKIEASKEQKQKLYKNNQSLSDQIGRKLYVKFIQEDKLHYIQKSQVIDVVKALNNNRKEWLGLRYLNSENPKDWENSLYKIIDLCHCNVCKHKQIVTFIQKSSSNWEKKLSEILEDLKNDDIDIDTYFLLEKQETYNIAGFLSDFNIMQQEILSYNIDISSFVQKMSNAFLPSIVFQLEEFGLPRMISKKIQTSGIINFEDNTLTIKGVIEIFNSIGFDEITSSVRELDKFDKYILKYFYDGISNN